MVDELVKTSGVIMLPAAPPVWPRVTVSCEVAQGPPVECVAPAAGVGETDAPAEAEAEGDGADELGMPEVASLDGASVAPPEEPTDEPACAALGTSVSIGARLIGPLAVPLDPLQAASVAAPARPSATSGSRAINGRTRERVILRSSTHQPRLGVRRATHVAGR
jgi:hypothetical protein